MSVNDAVTLRLRIFACIYGIRHHPSFTVTGVHYSTRALLNSGAHVNARRETEE